MQNMIKTKISETWTVSDDSKRYKFNVVLDYEKRLFHVIDLTSSVEIGQDGDITMMFLNGERLSIIISIKQFIEEYFFKMEGKTDDLSKKLHPGKIKLIPRGKSHITTIERNCTVCGKTFLPTGNRQVKCKECKT